MSQVKLVATAGRTTGSSASRRLRAADHIPGVLYGHGMTPLTITVERRELRIALSGAAGVNTVLALEVDGNSYPAVIKELQRHPIKRTVSHIDFLQVGMHEEIIVQVPLRLEGEARAVLDQDGLVDPAVNFIEVTTTPTNMPAELVVDITAMQIGDVIRLGDLTMPAGVTPHGDPDMPVVTALLPALEIPEPEVVEAEEGEEVAEAAAEGEAPAEAPAADTAAE